MTEPRKMPSPKDQSEPRQASDCAASDVSPARGGERVPYTPPSIVQLGLVRDLTYGANGTAAENATQKFP